MDPINRYIEKLAFDPNCGCWTWAGASSVVPVRMAAKVNHPYGNIKLDGKVVKAHHVFYRELVGTIPAGMVLDHLCKNTLCVNPAHLQPVSGKVNTLRGESPSAIHAKQTHCDNGHEFTILNTYNRKRGGRACRACHNERSAQRRANLKGAAL